MRTLCLAALVLLGAAGCRNVQRTISDWRTPGPAEIQQGRAGLHDPYPDREIGPAVVGGRPRDFERADPEPSRLPRIRDLIWNR